MGVNVGVSLHVQAKRRVGQCCGVNGIAVAAVSGGLQAGSNRYRGLGLGGGGLEGEFVRILEGEFVRI